MSTESLSDHLLTRAVSRERWLGVERPVAFTDPDREYLAAREHVGLLDRSFRGKVTLRGDDLYEFLGGIVSAPVGELGDGEETRALFLSAKGKILGHFRVVRHTATEARLDLREPVREEMLQALRRYAFLSDIEVEDSTAGLGELLLVGTRSLEVAVEVLDDFVPPEPGRAGAGRLGEIEIAVSLDDELEDASLRFLFEAGAGVELWEALLTDVERANGAAVGLEASEMLRIERGTGIQGIDFTSDHFPADVGLAGDLDYTRCYVGQEVVARMRTYGQPNRQLRGLRFQSDRAIEAGSGLEHEGQGVGTVTSSGLSPRGGSIGLALLPRRVAAPGTELTVEGGNPRAKVVELPFPSGPEAAGNSPH